MNFPEKILITNDDGIDAPGIRLLEQVVLDMGVRPIVAAPADAHSGCSHRINLYTPFLVHTRQPHEFCVEGTPADCVRVALHSLAPDVQLVLSGVNAGGNMGHDTYLSGTVAAAREAAFNGVPAIALSQYISPGMHLDPVGLARRVRRVLEMLLEQPWPDRAFWNVNFPDLPPDAEEPAYVHCERCRSPLPNRYAVSEAGYQYQRGHYHARTFDPCSDVETCLGGNVAITLLPL